MKLFGGYRSNRTRKPAHRYTGGAPQDNNSTYYRRENNSSVSAQDGHEQPVRRYPDEAAQKRAPQDYNREYTPAEYANNASPDTQYPAAAFTRTGRRKRSKKYRRKRLLRRLAITLVVLVCLYLTAVYSNIPFIKKYREIYINAAMETMSHQWLATAFIPKSVIDKVVNERKSALEDQIGLQSIDPPAIVTNPFGLTQPDDDPFVGMTDEDEVRTAFYRLFWELDEASMESYLAAHPEAFENGYEGIDINEAGLDDSGTEIYTKMGEQVLAINSQDQVLIVRVKGSTFRGVLAIAKNPSRLSLQAATSIGSYGETVDKIAERTGGILAMTGSGFLDDGGVGTGGELAGTCVCNGVTYGDHHMGWGNMRIELHENNWFYITDAPTNIGSDVTDASEFTPALVVNGEKVVDSTTFYNAMNPRACIGQSAYGEILMIGIEGRFLDSPGCSVVECADIFMQHKCQTALNLDGGTSAIVWYKGECIMRCSNTDLPNGRYLPNAWVYTD